VTVRCVIELNRWFYPVGVRCMKIRRGGKKEKKVLSLEVKGSAHACTVFMFGFGVNPNCISTSKLADVSSFLNKGGYPNDDFNINGCFIIRLALAVAEY